VKNFRARMPKEIFEDLKASYDFLVLQPTKSSYDEAYEQLSLKYLAKKETKL
jgi:hypothetical protein